MTNTTNHEPSSQSNAHAERSRPSYDDVNVPVVFLVGVISMILTFVTIWFVEGIYYKWRNALVQERSYDIVNTIQTETIAGQKAILDGDEDRGITSFDSVIDSVVGKYKNAASSMGADEPSQDSHGQENHGDIPKGEGH